METFLFIAAVGTPFSLVRTFEPFAVIFVLEISVSFERHISSKLAAAGTLSISMSSVFLSVGTFSIFTNTVPVSFHTIGTVFEDIVPVERSILTCARSLEDSLSGYVSENAG